MALALRADRDEVMSRAQATRARLRAEGPAHARVLVKSTVGVRPVPVRVPPQLVVVPRRRRAARLIGVAFTLIFVMMVVAASFQTQLARRQLVIDKLDRQIAAAHDQYSSLREQRAELRSIGRLTIEAGRLGMVQGTTTHYIEIDPAVVAEVQQSAGGVMDRGIGTKSADTFEAFGAVKAVSGDAP